MRLLIEIRIFVNRSDCEFNEMVIRNFALHPSHILALTNTITSLNRNRQK